MRAPCRLHYSEYKLSFNYVYSPSVCVCVQVGVMMCLYLLSPQPIDHECRTSSHYIFNPGHLLRVADRCCHYQCVCLFECVLISMSKTASMCTQLHMCRTFSQLLNIKYFLLTRKNSGQLLLKLVCGYDT